MKKSTRIDRERDAALTMQIRSRDRDDKTPIKDFIVINDKLYAFKLDAIFQIRLADDIDPERIHPEAKGSTVQLYDVGTQNSVVARTIIQTKQLLDSVHLNKARSSEMILNQAFSVFHELTNCYVSYRDLVHDFSTGAAKLESVIAEAQGKPIFGDIPQIQNLQTRTRDFFVTARKVLAQVLGLLNAFFPDVPRFQHFDQVLQWLAHNYPKDNRLRMLIESDIEWIRLLWHIRNAIEHPENSMHNFEILNFEPMPTGKFYPPRWRYSFPDHEQRHYTDLLADTETYMENLIGFVEEVTVASIAESWNAQLPFEIYRRPEDKLDPECPTRYFVGLNQSKLTKGAE